MNKENPQKPSSISYEDYDYSDFWKGRDYENQSDKIAVSRLFSMIKVPHDKIIDIGGGMGRMTPLYQDNWDEFVVLDSSQRQIEVAQKNIHNKKAKFVVGAVENIPFPDSSFDTVLCVRTFHYVVDINGTLGGVNRILKLGGYLVLEIPNKIHFKNRLGAMFGKNSRAIFSPDPINITTKGDALFLDHHPKTILKLLKSNNFEIVEILSVSNFRSNFIKKLFSISFLTKLEKFTQKILAPLWFGPSIYVLARKLRNN